MHPAPRNLCYLLPQTLSHARGAINIQGMNRTPLSLVLSLRVLFWV